MKRREEEIEVKRERASEKEERRERRDEERERETEISREFFCFILRERNANSCLLFSS